MAKEAKAQSVQPAETKAVERPAPPSLSLAKVTAVRLVRGILVRSRSVSLNRFEVGESKNAAYSGDTGSFDLSIHPVGAVIRDLKKGGETFLVPWVNVELVEIAGE